LELLWKHRCYSDSKTFVEAGRRWIEDWLNTAIKNKHERRHFNSGPATIDGDTLKFTKIPRRAKFPIRVTVSAFQWGRSFDLKIQSAGPVTLEFLITK